jgi:hypothetical protein
VSLGRGADGYLRLLAAVVAARRVGARR